MKKFLSIMLLVGILATSIFTVACNKDDEVKFSATGITEMKVEGIEDYYITESTVDWTKVSVTLTYKNGDYKVNNNEIEFDTDSPKNTTKVVVYTSNLSSQEDNALGEGTYVLTAKAVGSNDTHSLKEVLVGDDLSQVSIYLAYQDSAALNTYKTNVATNNAANEGDFKTVTETYTVGDDNPFRLNSVLTVKMNDTKQNKTFTNFKAVWEVKEQGSTAALNNDENDYYTVKGATIDFTEAAIGKTFELSMKPYFEGKTITPTTLTVKVADGYNAYSALDLGVLNLANGMDDVRYEYEYYYNKATNDDQAAHSVFFASGVVNQRYYYATGDQNYYYADYSNIWEDFLTSKGYSIYGDNNTNGIKKPNGLFLHNDISVTEGDIPTQYFITAEEDSVGGAVGHLRDGIAVYYVMMNENFTLNGNYFTLDASAIRGCRSEAKGNHLNYYAPTEANPYGSQTALLTFMGKYSAEYSINPTNTTVYVKNLDCKGNTGTDMSGNATADLDKDTGLIFIRNRACSMEYVNSIVKEFFIGIFPDNVASTNSTKIVDSKIYDCFQTGIFMYDGDNTSVKTSELKRFGGGAIMAINDYRNGNNNRPKTWIMVDNETVIQNNVVGDEGWFAIQGATSIATEFAVMSQAFESTGKTLIKDGKFNLKVLVLESGYLGAKYANYEARYTRNYLDVAMHPNYATSQTDLNGSMAINVFNQVKQLLGQGAPIYQTAGGQLGILFPFAGSYVALDAQKVLAKNPADLQVLIYKLMNNVASQEDMLTFQSLLATGFNGDEVAILLPIGNTVVTAVIALNDLAQ